jgi:membrane protein YdbS with pleckstrin-like domain
MLLVAIATVDDVRRQLPAGEALFYYLGLAGVCAVCYVVFSVSTLYYIGYLLLVAYFVFAIHRYWRYAHCRYTCGHCGALLTQKGRCPHCGTVNT